MRSATFGLISEYIVILIYRLKFYSILAHRKRNFLGEIDIIALRAKRLVFIEVKARSLKSSTYIEDRFVSKNQISRIKKSAELFLVSNKSYQNYDIRFDFVLIRPFRLPLIIKNAF